MGECNVTVLMAVYNGEKYLREALESILHQTFTDFEFLIINDASTDGSVKILQSYEDSRIRIVNNENNLGLTKSLNKGLSIAKGKYIARMDADDISHPERLEIQYHYIENNPEVSIVGSWTEVIDQNGNTTDFWKCPYSPEDIYYILNFRNCLTHSSVMFRKDIIIQNGGYNEAIDKAQDYELWHRISKVSIIYQIQHSLVKWRKDANSTDVNKRQKQNLTVDTVVKKNLELLMNEYVDKNMYFLIKNYFEINDRIYIKKLNSNELYCSIKFLKKVNSKIVESSPLSLDKQIIEKIGDEQLIHYLNVASIRMNFQHIIICLLNCTSYNAYFKMMFLARAVYKKMIY